MRLFGLEVLKSDNGFVAVDVLQMEKVGHQGAFHFYKGRVQLGIVFRAVHVEEENHLALDAPRLGDFAQLIAFFFGHRSFVLSYCPTSCVNEKKRVLCNWGTLFLFI